MPAFELPANLVDALVHEDAGSDRRRWVAQLPDLVAELAGTWSLEIGRPYQPGGVVSWVAPARTATGEQAVLNVAWRHDEALHEADGLRLWDGAGTVRLIDFVRLDRTDALLSRRASRARRWMPRSPRRNRMWWSPACCAGSGSVRHSARPFLRCRTCAIGGPTNSSASTQRGARRCSTPASRAGTELFRLLPGSADREVLLCTDLHAGNVLAARREPWLVIDPKPYVGDPVYDVLQHMLNCPDRLVADAVGFSERIAELNGVDAARLREWLFARCVLESLYLPGTREAAVALAP